MNAKEHLHNLYPQGRPYFGITIEHIQAILDDGRRQGMIEAINLLEKQPFQPIELDVLLSIREHSDKLFPKETV